MSAMTALKIILVVLISIIIAGTLISHHKKEHWWVRAFDFPRLQILGLGLLFLVAWYFVWEGTTLDYVFGALLILAMADQLWKILPYTPFYPRQVITCKDVRGFECFKLLVANVYMDNRQAEKALKLIKEADPDIIIGLETDEWWVSQFQQINEHYPFRVEVPKDNTYGMILYSRFELENPKVEYLLVDDVPSIHTKVILPDLDYFYLYAVHPKPPMPGHSKTSVKRDAELIMVGRKTRDVEHPVVVAGDLNDVAWSYTTNLFQKFSELLDPRIGRGMFNTFHAGYKLFRWPLDHVFHSDHFQVLNIKTLPYFGSDHFPILIELCMKRSERHRQEEPEADEEEEEEAKEKVVQAKLEEDD